MDRDGVEVHQLAKKERGQYPAILTEQAFIKIVSELVSAALLRSPYLV